MGSLEETLKKLNKGKAIQDQVKKVSDIETLNLDFSSSGSSYLDLYMDNQNLTAQAQVNAVVLANAADIGARVIARIAGNDIANTLHGESATKDKLSFLLVGQLTNEIKKSVK